MSTTLVDALSGFSVVRLEPDAYRGLNRAPPNRRSLITPPSAGDKQRHNSDLKQLRKLLNAFAVSTPQPDDRLGGPAHALSVAEKACINAKFPLEPEPMLYHMILPRAVEC